MKKIKVTESALKKIMGEGTYDNFFNDLDSLYDEFEDGSERFRGVIEPILKSCGFYLDSCTSCSASASNDNISIEIDTDDDNIPYLSRFSGNFATSDPAHMRELQNLMNLFERLSKNV